MRLECAKIGLAAIDVPGDGNCLIWALRSLILGLREMAPPDSDMGKKDALNIRQTLKECWIDASSKIVWQDLFLVFIEQDNAPQTPEKRTAKAGNLVDIVDLLTPPEKEKHPKKKPKKPSPKKLAVDRVGGGRPAQAEEFTPSPTLKKPPPKKTSPSIAPPTEQPPPDEGKKRKVNSIDITDWVDEMLEEELISDVESPDEAEEGEPTRKRRKHNRVKKKVKTEREIEEDLVREFLAVRNVTYANWLLVHRRMCSIPKASVCDEGGFLRFTTAIRINKDIKCKSWRCVGRMEFPIKGFKLSWRGAMTKMWWMMIRLRLIRATMQSQVMIRGRWRNRRIEKTLRWRLARSLLPTMPPLLSWLKTVMGKGTSLLTGA